jgi:hypothetical protein
MITALVSLLVVIAFGFSPGIDALKEERVISNVVLWQ